MAKPPQPPPTQTPPPAPPSRGTGEVPGHGFEPFQPGALARAPKRGLSVEEEFARAGELHRRLHWAVTKSGLSVEAVAAAAGVGGDYLRNIGRGGARHPSFFTIMAIARETGVSPFFLAIMTNDPETYQLNPR